MSETSCFLGFGIHPPDVGFDYDVTLIDLSGKSGIILRPLEGLSTDICARFKVESVYAEQPTRKQEAYSLVFEYIGLLYNRVRRLKSPAEYEQEYHEKCA